MELKTTAGSAANLRLLTGEYLQLAIAQGDLAQDAYDQTGIFADEEETRGFGAVAALYTETCQIVVRADADIQSVEDLQGKTVSIGAEESGSEQNALQILAAYGLNDKLVDTVNLNYEDAAAQLKAGKVDAIFITAGAPSPVLTELAGECGIRLLNVDGAAAQRLQLTHHMGVVDDAAQHHAAALFTGRLLRQLHRTLHTVAEPGALRLNDAHRAPPSSYT